MKVKIEKIYSGAILPTYQHGSHEDAGLDLRSLDRVILRPGSPVSVSTGIAIELPPRYEAQVRGRSGLAMRHAISVHPGTIDPGYRGEIRVIMFNLGHSEYHVEPGDRIAQLVISKYEAVEWVETELSGTERGEGGLGSTGK
jgi:dUTP pyrophosphatase